MTGSLEHEWSDDSSILDLIAWYCELLAQQAVAEVEAEFGELPREGAGEREPKQTLGMSRAGLRQSESQGPSLDQSEE